jgi:predicted phosphodiesterase
VRIAIISDIHEDILALRKVLEKIDRAGYDRLVCLGDVSGFSVPYYEYVASRSAHDCLSLLREKDAIIVPGNHDYHAALRIPEHSPAFSFPSDWYELEYSQRKMLAQNEVWLHEENDLDPLFTSEDIQYLQSLPEYHVMRDAGDHHLLFCHYAYPNLSGFVKKFFSLTQEFGQHFEFMSSLGCTIGFTGHSHVCGYSIALPRYFDTYRYGRRRLESFPVIVGVPPVTRHKNRTGFCIFDTAGSLLQVIRSSI